MAEINDSCHRNLRSFSKFSYAGNVWTNKPMRRSVASISSNIAEGYGRNSTGDYKRFLQIAVGSLFELQTQVETAFNLNYFAKDLFQHLVEITKELDRMLLSLINKIK